MLLELLNETLLEGETLPSNYYQTKKVLYELDLHYMLYSKEHANANECMVCGVSRWKSNDVHPINEFNQSSKKKKILAKVSFKTKTSKVIYVTKIASHMK